MYRSAQDTAEHWYKNPIEERMTIIGKHIDDLFHHLLHSIGHLRSGNDKMNYAHMSCLSRVVYIFTFFFKSEELIPE